MPHSGVGGLTPSRRTQPCGIQDGPAEIERICTALAGSTVGRRNSMTTRAWLLLRRAPRRLTSRRRADIHLGAGKADIEERS